MPEHPQHEHAGEEAIVATHNLSKVFKDFWLRDRARAVDSITFQIHRGEVFGLLGPNGSGKSTTIKMILGLLKRSGGHLSVVGKAPQEVDIKRRIGYLPEESYLYPFLNARETLEYYAKLFGLERKTAQRRVDELLEMVGLAGVQHRQVREYSKGMQRRIGLAQALINDPEFLILDEPTTGLDPIGTRQVKDLIVTLGKRGKTILLSSHLLSDVEDVVSRMVILYGGKIRAEGTCEELLESRDRSIVQTDSLDDETLAELRSVLERRGHAIEGVSRPRQKLEELFVDIVDRARSEQLATSGASNDGSTAAFLQGDEQGGDALIEQLVAGEPEIEAPEVERPPARRAPEQPDVIESLVSKDAAPEPEPVEEATSSDAVDDEVISSLLGDDEDEPKR
ncbi:MAG: ABC transporter ATP-binding protein [Planctomycetota bacterium]